MRLYGQMIVMLDDVTINWWFLKFGSTQESGAASGFGEIQAYFPSCQHLLGSQGSPPPKKIVFVVEGITNCRHRKTRQKRFNLQASHLANVNFFHLLTQAVGKLGWGS